MKADGGQDEEGAHSVVGDVCADDTTSLCTGRQRRPLQRRTPPAGMPLCSLSHLAGRRRPVVPAYPACVRSGSRRRPAARANGPPTTTTGPAGRLCTSWSGACRPQMPQVPVILMRLPALLASTPTSPSTISARANGSITKTTQPVGPLEMRPISLGELLEAPGQETPAVA